MLWIDSKWSIITPLLLHGFNNRQDSELRAPSIKALMRYWWRALQGNYNLKNLIENEEKYFGSSSERFGRSKFDIKIHPLSEVTKNKFLVLPYRNFKINGININQKFTIRLQTRKNSDFLIKILELLYLSLTLGGLGQRARRAFGAVMFAGISEGSAELLNYENIRKLNELKNLNQLSIEKILEFLFEKINNLSGVNYILEKNDRMIRINQNRLNSSIPYLISTQVGKTFQSWDALWREINKLCHDLKGKYDRNPLLNNEYLSMGFTPDRSKNIKEKMASSLYISAIKIENKYHPILSKLNPVFPPKFRFKPKDPERVPNEFINGLS